MTHFCIYTYSKYFLLVTCVLYCSSLLKYFQMKKKTLLISDQETISKLPPAFKQPRKLNAFSPFLLYIYIYIMHQPFEKRIHLTQAIIGKWSNIRLHGKFQLVPVRKTQ